MLEAYNTLNYIQMSEVPFQRCDANTAPSCSPLQLYKVHFLIVPRVTMDNSLHHTHSLWCNNASSGRTGPSLEELLFARAQFSDIVSGASVRYFSKYKFRAFLWPSIQAIRLWPSSLQSWFNVAYKYCHWSSAVCLSVISWGGSRPLQPSSHEKEYGKTNLMKITKMRVSYADCQVAL